jgi:hypothetical protein
MKKDNTQETLFTNAHHNIYEGLRQTLMGYVQAGVPGMDKVLQALTSSHIAGLSSRGESGAMPVKTSTPAEAGKADDSNLMENAINHYIKSQGNQGGQGGPSVPPPPMTQMGGGQ